MSNRTRFLYDPEYLEYSPKDGINHDKRITGSEVICQKIERWFDEYVVHVSICDLLQQMGFIQNPGTCQSRNAGKRALRDLGTRLLGREIAEAPKAGFQAPFSAWFSGPLREYVRAKINSLGEALPGVLDSQVLDRVEREHADGVRDHGLKLWGIVALSEWSQTYPGIRTEDPQEERPPS